jgi:hypothetical protein
MVRLVQPSIALNLTLVGWIGVTISHLVLTSK